MVRLFEVRKLGYMADKKRHNSPEDDNPEPWKRVTYNKRAKQKDAQEEKSKIPLNVKRNDNANLYKRKTS